MLRLNRFSAASPGDSRRGAFMVLALFCLVASLAFVALCVDIGYLSLTKQRMQNAVDAAALAAAMEITHAVQNAGEDVEDVTAYAINAARTKAAAVANLNGVYVDPNADVVFGLRTPTGPGTFSTIWNHTPANTVKVVARKTNSDPNAPDAKLNLFFAGVLGDKTASLTTNAQAYIEARDIVTVLDFSGSMNDDSTYSTLGTRDRTDLEENMLEIYDILNDLRDFGDLEFEPEWLTQTDSSGAVNGTVVFRNTAIDVTSSHNMSSVQLYYSDGTSQTQSASGTSGTFQRTGGSLKTINQVDATCTYEDWGGVASANGSNSGRTATVTFNNSTSVSVTTSHNMSTVKLYYYPSGSQSFSRSGTSASATGSGSYISHVQVKMGSYWVTVNNPNGSSPEIITEVLNFYDNTTNVKTFFGLDGTWPYASGSWSDFVDYVRTDSQINNAGYRRKYGGKCLVNYLLTKRPAFSQCEDLWRTPHYPFHSLKQGAELFADFLGDLGFGDQLGFVSYDTSYRIEHSLNYDGYTINNSADPINDSYDDYQAIIHHKQASHYLSTTNIGGGLLQGKLLLDASARPGTTPTILLMTDGLPNVRDTSWTLPGDWDWDELFDYDQDGVRDYYTDNLDARYALGMAKAAADDGYVIHTLSVGLGADVDLMEAIAWLGHGITITVPGDQTVSEMEEDVLEAFNRIAAWVPPAKLIEE